jgi:hypothetical protein
MLVIPKYKKQGYVIPLFQVGGAAFTNMPDGDAVEVLSDNTGDTNKLTIFGTNKTTGLLKYETVTMDGTTVVTTDEDDWGNVYGLFLGDIYGKNSSVAVGTITVREASGNQAITTIAAGVRSRGSQIFLLPGRDILMHFISGNTWKNANHSGVYPTTNNAFKFTAGMSKDEDIREYLYLLGDVTGSTVQIEVTEDVVS